MIVPDPSVNPSDLAPITRADVQAETWQAVRTMLRGIGECVGPNRADDMARLATAAAALLDTPAMWWTRPGEQWA